jgi:hypothetical protein
MRVRLRQAACGAGGLALLTTMFVGASAGASTVHPSVAAKSFASTSFKAYSSGEFAHINALDLGGTALADAEASYATSSVNSSGLTSALHGDSTNGGLLIQPAQKAGVKAYGSGSSVVADLNASSPTADLLPDLASQVGPPYNPTIKTTDLDSDGLPSLLGDSQAGSLDGLVGSANANFTNSCLIGKPLGYGAGNATAINLLNETDLPGVSDVLSGLNGDLSGANTLIGVINGLLGTAGLGSISTYDGSTNNGFLVETNGTTQTLADSYLTPEGGGKWGVSSFESTEPSPVRINLLGLADITVAITGANSKTSGTTVPSPIRLVATATGGSSGASLSLQDTDVISVIASVAGQKITLLAPTAINSLPAGGVSIPLSLGGTDGILTQGLDAAINAIPGASAVTGLLSALTSATGALPTGSLGTLTIGGNLHAIGSSTGLPVVKGGTTASGSYTLAQLNLSPSVANVPTATLADIALGHLESSVNLSSPISCGVPATASSSGAGNVTVGGSTTVKFSTGGSSSMAALLACHVSSTKITDELTSSTTRFTVSGASSGGKVTKNGLRSSTVTWTGKTIGSGGISGSAKLSVPKGAGTGSIKSTVSVSGTLAGCNNATAANPYKQIANGRLISGTATHTVGVKK